MENQKIIKRDRIVTTDIKDILLCKICMEVLEDPVECSECNSAYCRNCMEIWHAKNPSCPNRCQPFHLQKPHKVLLQMLNTLEITCENIENGCKHICSAEAMFKHEHICDYKVSECPNKKNGCGFKGFSKDIKEHELVCEYSKVQCNKGCEQLILRNQLAEHSCIKYLALMLKEEQKLLAETEEKLRKLKLRNLTYQHYAKNAGYVCAICKENDIMGPVYVCPQCEQYSVCEICAKNKKHSHELKKIPNEIFETNIVSTIITKRFDIIKNAIIHKYDVQIKIENKNKDEAYELRFMSKQESEIEYLESDFFHISARNFIIKHLIFEIPERKIDEIKNIEFWLYSMDYDKMFGLPIIIS